jgi:hypothetical protein
MTLRTTRRRLDADGVPDGLGLEESEHPPRCRCREPVGIAAKRTEHPLHVRDSSDLEISQQLGGGSRKIEGIDIAMRG